MIIGRLCRALEGLMMLVLALGMQDYGSDAQTTTPCFASSGWNRPTPVLPRKIIGAQHFVCGMLEPDLFANHKID
jgi:hypothetical protein